MLRDPSVGESQSLGQPEKAGRILLEARVGRPTVYYRNIIRNGMVMFIREDDTSPFFYLSGGCRFEPYYETDLRNAGVYDCF